MKHLATTDCFWIAHDPSLHFGELEKDNEISTGQEHLEIFEDETEWAERVIALGGDPYPSEDDTEEESV